MPGTNNILIGRYRDCSIKLKDNLISEFQKKNLETEAKLK